MRLRRTIDTRPLERTNPMFPDMRRPGYTGDHVGTWMDQLIREGIAGGYDAVELEWWDFCEGWATMSADLSAISRSAK